MKVQVTEQEIRKAVEELNDALEFALDAQSQLDDFKYNVDIERNRAIASGIEGKNEAERKANLEAQFEHENEVLFGMQKAVNRARLGVSIAENNLSALRNIVRLYVAVTAAESIIDA